jgi:hypothetical protein
MPLPNPSLFKKDQSYDPIYGGLGFGGEEECITQRPTSTALFCISSADRYATVEESRNEDRSPYRFTITKKESLLNGFFTRMALSEIRFPFSLPNVAPEVFTNKIGITCSVDSAIITLTGGFYDGATLAENITNLWNISHPANEISMVFSEADGTFLLEAFTIPASPVSVFPLTPNTLETYPLNTYQLFDMMGFTTINSTPDTVQSSGSGFNLLWTDYVDIVATNLTYNQALKDSSSSQVTRDIIYRVYLTDGYAPYQYAGSGEFNLFNSAGTAVAYSGALQHGSSPCLIYRQFQNPKEIRWSKNQPIGQVTFEVYDDKGRCLADLFGATSPYQSPQSANWNMTMLVSEN